MAQPLAGVVERQAAALGERCGHRLEAVLQDAVEEAGRADRDRQVRQAADVAVDGPERLGICGVVDSGSLGCDGVVPRSRRSSHPGRSRFRQRGRLVSRGTSGSSDARRSMLLVVSELASAALEVSSPARRASTSSGSLGLVLAGSMSKDPPGARRSARPAIVASPNSPPKPSCSSTSTSTPGSSSTPVRRSRLLATGLYSSGAKSCSARRRGSSRGGARGIAYSDHRRNHRACLTARHVQGADHREGGEVDQLGGQAGTARRRQQVLDAVAARGRPRGCACAHPARRRCAPAAGGPAPPARAASEAPPGPGTGSRRRAPARSSIAGSSSTRTAIFWLATPSRTCLGRSCSRKNACSRSARPSTSTTSPSWKRPGPRLVVAARTSVGAAVRLNSAAATKPGSMSSPTIERVFDLKSPIPCELAGLGAMPWRRRSLHRRTESDASSIGGRRASL